MESVATKPLVLNKKKPMWKRILGCWELYLFLLPAVVITIIFRYIPIYGIQLAFKDMKFGQSIAEAPWVGLKHFQRFFGLNNFWQLIGNTAKTAIYNLIFNFPLPVIFALMLNQVRNERAKKLVQNISYIPHLFSVVVVIAITNVFLAPSTGIINIVIQKLGGDPVLFFGHDKYVRPIYIITNIWSSTGFSAIIYLAALSGIDQEQLEAAKIDGANRMRIIWHIEIPALISTIVIQLVLGCGSMFAVGPDKMLLLQTELNRGASEIISTYSYKTGLIKAQYGFSTAISLFNTIVNIICLVTVNTICNKLSDTSVF